MLLIKGFLLVLTEWNTHRHSLLYLPCNRRHQIKTHREAHLDFSGWRTGLVPGLVCHNASRHVGSCGGKAIMEPMLPQKPPFTYWGRALYISHINSSVSKTKKKEVLVFHRASWTKAACAEQKHYKLYRN